MIKMNFETLENYFHTNRTVISSTRVEVPSNPKYFQSLRNPVRLYFRFLSRLFMPRTELRLRFAIEKNTLNVTGGAIEPWDLEVQFLRYKPEHKTNQTPPVLIISPAIAGISFVEKETAQLFAERGYEVLIPIHTDDPCALNRPLNDLYKIHLRAVQRIQVLVDYAEDILHSAKDSIFGFGVSLGGMSIATATSVDQRIFKSVIVAAAGNFAECWTQSRQKNMKLYREHRMKLENITSLNDFFLRAQHEARVDPIHFANDQDMNRFLVILAGGDSDVPYEYQLKLWEALGRPDAKTLPFGHILTILSYPIFYQKIIRFLGHRGKNIPVLSL